MREWSAVYPRVTGEALAVPLPSDEAPGDAVERLELLFDHYHPRLYRLARRLCRSADEARDLVQETFLRAVQAAETIPAGASPEEAWLVRVLINICRDGWRRQAVRRRLDPVRAGDIGADRRTEDQYVARAAVWQALDSLPPRRRAALVLYELEGATIPAIAAMLGVAPVTVRWHLSRGRRDLARAIRRREGQEQ